MVWIDLVRVAHVLGACVLIGTGVGIAFFMVMAHRSGDPEHIAQTATIVVIADFLFTATAVVAQPVTGVLLAIDAGWPLLEGWLGFSLALYVLIGAFWVPVVFIQMRMLDEARAAVQSGAGLSRRYHALYRIWFGCGVPAFAAILVLLWLMVIRPPLWV